jgi:hypothetical protein
MKNVTLDRTTVLQLDADGTDSALDAAADCHILRNDAALDLCAIADLEIRGAQLAFDSAQDLRLPLHSILPTIDMSEPMQEAVPALVVGSDPAQAWSCGTTLPMTSAALTDAFLSFSGAPRAGSENLADSVGATHLELLNSAPLTRDFAPRDFLRRDQHGEPRSFPVRVRRHQGHPPHPAKSAVGRAASNAGGSWFYSG